MIRLSIFCGAIFFPPAVFILSFLRSVMRRNPSSSRYPIFPVWYHPSPSNTFFFSARGFFYFLLAVGYAEESFLIEISDIACMEPPLAVKYFLRRRFFPEITLHYAGPGDKDLSVRRYPDLSVTDRPADRAELKRLKGIDGDDWRRLRKAVSFEYKYPDRIEEFPEFF